MGKVLILSLICLIFVVVPASADTEPVYQLHVPTAEEYLAAIPTIMSQAQQDYPGPYNGSFQQFTSLTWTEIQAHNITLSNYPYTLIAPIHRYYTINYLNGIGKDLIAAWLRDTSSDLDDFNTEHTLNFDDFVIKVTRRDFDVDGQHEWVLDINQGDRYTWKEVVQATASGQYRLIKTPLFMFDSDAHYTFYKLAEELTFEDLNQDGLPEWVIAMGGAGGGHQNHGFLSILQWREGELINLAETERIDYSAPAGGGQPLFPYGTSIDLKDADANGTIDIVVQQQKYDNWTCTWTQTRIYGWKNTQYTILADLRLDDEVKGCGWSAAETAMWKSDYKTAIAEYERALTLPFAEDFTHPYWGSYATDLWEYAQVRLALAYALVNRPQDAEAALNNLYQSGIQSDAAWQMSAILLQTIHHTAPVEICQVIYDLWFGYVDAPPEDWESDAMQYDNRIPTTALVGYTREFEPNGAWPSIPVPEKAGCDVTAYGRSLSMSRYTDVRKDYYSQFYRPAAESHLSYHRSTFIESYQVLNSLNGQDKKALLTSAYFGVRQAQFGLSNGDKWLARYIFATALRQTDHLDEALEQYIYIYENSPVASWRQMASLYLKPIDV